MKKWRCAVEARPVPSSTNCWQGRILFERRTFSAGLKIFEVPIVVILIRCVSSEAGFLSLKFKPVYRKFASLRGSLWHGTPMSSRPRAIGRSESLLQSHAKTATPGFTRRSASCLLFVSLSNLPRVQPARRNLDRAPIGKHGDVKTYWRKKEQSAILWCHRTQDHMFGFLICLHHKNYNNSSRFRSKVSASSLCGQC